MSLALLQVAFLVVSAAPAPAPVQRSIAVLRLEALSIAPDVARVVSDEVVRAVRQDGLFPVVRTPSELDVLLGNVQQGQLQRCANDECAIVDVEIAGALGVTHMLVGRVARLGESLVVQLKLLELQTAREIAYGDARTAKIDEALLLDAAHAATRALLVRAHDALHVPHASGDDGKPAFPLVAGGVALLALSAPLLVVGIAAGAMGALTYVVPYYVRPVSTPGVPRDARPVVFVVPAVAFSVVGVVIALLSAGVATVGALVAARGVMP